MSTAINQSNIEELQVITENHDIFYDTAHGFYYVDEKGYWENDEYVPTKTVFHILEDQSTPHLLKGIKKVDMKDNAEFGTEVTIIQD